MILSRDVQHQLVRQVIYHFSFSIVMCLSLRSSTSQQRGMVILRNLQLAHVCGPKIMKNIIDVWWKAFWGKLSSKSWYQTPLLCCVCVLYLSSSWWKFTCSSYCGDDPLPPHSFYFFFLSDTENRIVPKWGKGIIVKMSFSEEDNTLVRYLRDAWSWDWPYYFALFDLTEMREIFWTERQHNQITMRFLKSLFKVILRGHFLHTYHKYQGCVKCMSKDNKDKAFDLIF